MKAISLGIVGTVLGAAVALSAVGQRGETTRSLELVQSIPLPGVTGRFDHFAVDLKGRRLFVAALGNNTLEAIDLVAATWPMEEFRANFPMALDEAGQIVFIGCREPARLVALDAKTGQKVADLAISGDIDDLFFDAARGRLYASCGEGFIDVIERRARDRYEQRERVATSPGARTAYFSSELDRLFLAVPDRGPQKAEIRVYAVK